MADVISKQRSQTCPVAATESPDTHGVNAVRTTSGKSNRNNSETGVNDICYNDRHGSSFDKTGNPSYVVDENLVEVYEVSKGSRRRPDETRVDLTDNFCDRNDDNKKGENPINRIGKIISRDVCHDVDADGRECHPTKRLYENAQHELRNADDENSAPTQNSHDVTSNDVIRVSSHDVISGDDDDDDDGDSAQTDQKRRCDEKLAELATTEFSSDVLQRDGADESSLTRTDHEMELQEEEEEIENNALSTVSTNFFCFCGPAPRSSSSSYCCGGCCSRCHCCCCGVFSGQDTEPDNKRFVFKWYDVPLGVGGGVLYVVDVYTDLRLAEQYFHDGHVIFGSVTLAFVLLAYFVSVGYGLKEYYRFRRDEHATYKAPTCVWFVRILGTVLMLGPIINSVEYMFNGCKSRCVRCPDRGRYVRRMKNHYLNNAFLRLFEACLEAAPQLVFQLYVIITTAELYQLEGMEGAWRVLTVLSSWFSLAHTLTAFTKCRRNSDDALRPANIRHQIFHLLWRLAETGGRVLSLALFASLFRVWLLVVLVPHGLVMALWQFLQERDGSFMSVLIYFIYAYVFLFCFINNYSGGHSRIQYLAFYVLFYAENLVMLGLWYWFVPGRDEAGEVLGVGGDEERTRWRWTSDTTWYLIGSLASLPFHIFLQLVYYRCCHPSSDNIKTCLPRDKEVWKQHLLGPFTPVPSGESQLEEKQT